MKPAALKSPQSSLLNYFLIALLLCSPFFVAFCWQEWGMEVARMFHLQAPLWGYLAGVGVAFVILLSIFIWPVPQQDKKHLAILWMVKIILMLGLMLFYTSYYGTGVGFYERGLQPNFSWSLFQFGGGTANMIFLNSLISRVFPGSFYAAKMLFGLAGFIAVYLFYRAACIYRGEDDIRILYLLGLFPSILFWSSTMQKDPLTLLGLGIFGLGVVGYFKRKNGWYILLVIFGLLFATAMRAWLSLIFVIPLGAFFVMGDHGWGRKIVFAIFAFALFIAGLHFFADQFAIQSTQDVIQTTNKLSQGWARGGSGQQIKGNIGGIGDMIKFMPLGAFTALFRPLPGEVMNPFGLLAGLENLFILTLIALITWKGNWGRLKDPILAWAALTIIIWACIYGFVSYQNLGTAFRFKLQVMPLLVLLLLELSRRHSPQFSYSIPKRQVNT